MPKPTPEDDAKALADLEAEENQKKAAEEIAANQAARDAEIQANASAQAGMQTAPRPLKVVDLDERITAQTMPEGVQGQNFFFGDINLLKFPDGSTYHIQRRHVTIFDPKVIANLLEASKNSALKIFPE